MPYCLQDDFLSLKIQWESQEHDPTSSSKGAASQINASIMSLNNYLTNTIKLKRTQIYHGLSSGEFGGE